MLVVEIGKTGCHTHATHNTQLGHFADSLVQTWSGDGDSSGKTYSLAVLRLGAILKVGKGSVGFLQRGLLCRANLRHLGREHGVEVAHVCVRRHPGNVASVSGPTADSEPSLTWA